MKLDGYRMHARLDAGRVNILTRRGNDWTEKYPSIMEAIAGLPAQNAYLDGELCGVLPDGRTAFNLIQNASDTGEGALVFFLFDLLFLDGESLVALPLVERKERLASLLTSAPMGCSTMTTRSGGGQPSTGWPASTASKASSPSASVAAMSPIGDHG
jgi:bifunctional non-homologous end joining protein LigD